VATPSTLHVSQHPAVLHKLSILRDEKTEPKKFREIVRELSWLLGYEALADARVRPLRVTTHLGLFRDERTLRPVEYYNRLPDSASVDLCLILDPMLATGGSATAAIEVLKRWGAVTPVRIKLVNLIAAPEGVAAVAEAHPDVHIHCAALDRQLNDRGYIMPGLGDAGDRQFGTGGT
jgi:uracil phosphoribosyltransferase